MSYLGLHIGSPNRPRFSEYLGLSPNSPLACVVSLDQNVQNEVKRLSPSTVTFWRTQRNPLGQDNPPVFMDIPLDRMKDTAAAWMDGLRALWFKNVHDALIVNNEQDIGTLEHARKLNVFNLECMRIAETWNAKIGICSLSTGNPSDDGGLTLEQRWEPMLPCVQHAAENGHYIVLHAHVEGQRFHFDDIGFRHERSLQYFYNNGIDAHRPWVVLGEWSNGVGGVEKNLNDYMENVRAWDLAAMAHPWSSALVGAALYGFNAGESLKTATTQLLEWIEDNPGRVTTPPVKRTFITVTPARKVAVIPIEAKTDITMYVPFGDDVTVEDR